MASLGGWALVWVAAVALAAGEDEAAVKRFEITQATLPDAA